LRLQYIFKSLKTLSFAPSDLLKHIIELKKLPLKQARKWFKQLVKAVRYLHLNGIAHRDVKLENIFLSENGDIKLGDFGYSRPVKRAYYMNSNFLEANTFCGSKAYAAPEVIRGIPYNPLKTDVWSLGVLLSIFINGMMPFTENEDILTNMLKRNMNTCEKAMKNLPENAKQLLYDMLDPNAEMRPDINQIANDSWLL
jgi:serine kinase